MYYMCVVCVMSFINKLYTYKLLLRWYLCTVVVNNFFDKFEQSPVGLSQVHIVVPKPGVKGLMVQFRKSVFICINET